MGSKGLCGIHSSDIDITGIFVHFDRMVMIIEFFYCYYLHQTELVIESASKEPIHITDCPSLLRHTQFIQITNEIIVLVQ